MKPSEALALKRQSVLALIRQSCATNPRVFGSVLHGTDTENSDLDLLVDPLPGATLLRLARLQRELRESLQVEVQVITPGDLSPGFRAQVIAEARPI